MSAAEDRVKARELAHWLRSSTCRSPSPNDEHHNLNCNVVTDKVESALRSAREEERGRCAEIARQEFAETPGYSGAGDIIARAIEADPNLQKMQIAPSDRAG